MAFLNRHLKGIEIRARRVLKSPIKNKRGSSHFLVEYTLSLWLKIADDNLHLPDIFDEQLQLVLEFFQVFRVAVSHGCVCRDGNVDNKRTNHRSGRSKEVLRQ